MGKWVIGFGVVALAGAWYFLTKTKRRAPPARLTCMDQYFEKRVIEKSTFVPPTSSLDDEVSALLPTLDLSPEYFTAAKKLATLSWNSHGKALGLSFEETLATYLYTDTTNFYRTLNEVLRSQDSSLKQQWHTITFRLGMALTKVWLKKGAGPVLHRYATLPKEVLDQHKAACGRPDELIINGFMSTSTKTDLAFFKEGANVHYILTPINGAASIADISAVPGESEFLVPWAACLSVSKVEWNDKDSLWEVYGNVGSLFVKAAVVAAQGKK